MQRRTVTAVPLAVLLSLVLVVALAMATTAETRNFAAPLSGDQEVPPVETSARGLATFKLSADGGSFDFRLNVANIANVTQAHIHLAPRGDNGPVVVWLYPDGPPAQLMEGRFDGVLAEGVITEADLVGPLADKSLGDLVNEIRAGDAYVNVHTSQFPGGEIRGQIDVPRGD